MNQNELYHYGVKGMRWGVRRYQNKDGSLNRKGLKRYRREYDNIKQEQLLSERTKTTNKTGLSFADNYNSRYYDKNAQNKMNLLMRKIGDRGISQIDNEVIHEGKIAAEKVKREAEKLNASLDLSIEGNRDFLVDPQREYNNAYNSYLQKHLINR